MSGEAGSRGVSAFVWYSAVVSLELAFFNILPIFPLDGGKMFLLLVQNVMGVAVDEMVLLIMGIVLAIFVVIPVLLPIVQKGRNFLSMDEISPFSR
jgi:regulator of sigma E protease